MSGLFKWFVGIVTVPFCAIAVPIFIEIVLPIIKKWMGFSVIVIALAWTATTAQAQLLIDVYPSHDNENQTIWISHGVSAAGITTSIRSSGNYHARDSWKIAAPSLTTINVDQHASWTNFYTANKPTNQVLNLSPLFSSANNPLDIESIQTGLTNSGWPLFTPALFASNTTNAPTMTIGSVDQTSASIGGIFMNDAAQDEIGIRVSSGELAYTNGQSTAWHGAGVLNKPIGDFRATEWRNALQRPNGYWKNVLGTPYFANVGITFHTSRIIPEPEQYYLVFGLFALAFVMVRRQFQRKGGIGA